MKERAQSLRKKIKEINYTANKLADMKQDELQESRSNLFNSLSDAISYFEELGIAAFEGEDKSAIKKDIKASLAKTLGDVVALNGAYSMKEAYELVSRLSGGRKKITSSFEKVIPGQ